MGTKYIWVFAILLILALPSFNACNKPVKPAEFITNKLMVTPNEAAPFENVTVGVEIGNIGELADNYTAILNIDGKETDKQLVSIEPAENKTIIFSFIEPDVGQHEVTVGTVKGTFTVYDTSIYLLQHDNNNWGDGLISWEPNGQWIKFSPPAVPFKISSIWVTGIRTEFEGVENKTYTIKIWDGDFKRELYSGDYPYTNFFSNEPNLHIHKIEPQIVVNGDFIVDFICHGKHLSDNWKNNIGIYLCVDFTTDSNKYIGYSSSGTNDISMWENALAVDPRFQQASWCIRVDGYGNKAAMAEFSQKSDPIGPWVYYPNDNVNWKINDYYYFDNGMGEHSVVKSCQQDGYIDNLHKELYMTAVTIDDVLITDWIEPGGRYVYAKEVGCRAPVLKWKWQSHR